jgi:Met-zincin/Domain of unknown function (DUF5117)
MQRFSVFLCSLALAALSPLAAPAAEAPAGDPYAVFTSGAQAQRGLFTLWRKDEHVYIDVTPAQLDKDYLETIVPGTGFGGNNIVWGNTDHLPAMLVRFHRVTGGNIAIVWPNTSFIAPGSASGAEAVQRNFPQSVVGIGKIVAENAGHVVFDAAPLFGDTLDLESIINESLGASGGNAYRLDAGRTYFGTSKAFPQNVLIHVEQLWASQALHVAPDTAPDSRSVQMDVAYNFVELPHDDGYIPRYADDRVGLYDDIYVSFSNDLVRDRRLHYLIRWNLRPSDPTKLSPATHPMVFYMSKSVPPEFRKPIRDAVLRWNQAFEKIGISDALQVIDQPDDANWDPEDVRYNVLRWVAEQRPSFGADSQTLYDPRTGEEFRTGILISADSARGPAEEWRTMIDPVRYGRDTDPMPQNLIYDSFQSEIMHETGHNLGMQHNFIGSMAYSAKDLQDPNFTHRFGIASTVMEYAPTNLWPHPYGQGDYYQTVLGPYDYYAMKYGYALIPGATTPEQELPTLERWADVWSDPLYRYASDEDVSWSDGHAADPRVEQGDLTSDPLAWYEVQMSMYRRLMDTETTRSVKPGEAYERASLTFQRSFYSYLRDATAPSHYIGGQYLSRAHRGDPGEQNPVVPVPIGVQKRAFGILDRYLFSDRNFLISSNILNRLAYSEWAGYGYVGWENYGNLPVWAYNPPARHDFPLSENVARAQNQAIAYMFSPAVLSRIVDNPSESNQSTMTLDDLFGWMQQSVYREVNARARSISVLRRNLQASYTVTLVQLATAPAKGAPADAQALARLELARVRDAAAIALHTGGADEVTAAHLASLVHQAEAALKP